MSELDSAEGSTYLLKNGKSIEIDKVASSIETRATSRIRESKREIREGREKKEESTQH